MKRIVSIIGAALLCIGLVLSSATFVMAGDQDANTPPDKEKIIEARAVEIQQHLSAGVNWDKLLPKLEELVEEELGYIPEDFGKDTGTRSTQYMSDYDETDFGNSYCYNEFSTAIDFNVLSVGVNGSLDTAWMGSIPTWYADEIELLAEWYMVTIYPYWAVPDDDGWWTNSATAYYSATVEEDWHIPYDVEDLGGALTGAGWLQEYQWAWYEFAGYDRFSLYCSDSCFGSW